MPKRCSTPHLNAGAHGGQLGCRPWLPTHATTQTPYKHSQGCASQHPVGGIMNSVFTPGISGRLQACCDTQASATPLLLVPCPHPCAAANAAAGPCAQSNLSVRPFNTRNHFTTLSPHCPATSHKHAPKPLSQPVSPKRLQDCATQRQVVFSFLVYHSQPFDSCPNAFLFQPTT